MAYRRKRAIWLGAVWLAACNNLPTQTDRPALIEGPTAESRAELRGVLEAALGGREIRLAPDALTRSPILALEQGAGSPGPARGRLIELPERFELVLNGDRCYLVRTATGDRFGLEQTRCVPASP